MHWPEQHVAAVAQVCPSDAHAVPCMQVPPEHFAEQQSASLAHASPSAVQPPGPHTPSVQSIMQQSLACAHALPFGPHTGGAPVLLDVVAPLVVPPPAPDVVGASSCSRRPLQPARSERQRTNGREEDPRIVMSRSLTGSPRS